MAAEAWRYPYDPSPVQQFTHEQQIDEILYGGAAGGGKTEYLLAEAITLLTLVPNSKALLIRRTLPEIEQEIQPRLLARIPSHIARFNVQKHTLTFWNGSILQMGYLTKDIDVYRYSGAEYQLIMFDELTTINIKSYHFLRSRNRAAGQVWKDMQKYGLKPRIRATSNPGGRSHGQVKALFVDPAPPMTPIVDPETGRTRMFVPAKLSDNPHVDPGYADTLKSLPLHLRLALLNGDWAVLEGVRFAQWREEMHVCEPYNPEELYSYPRVVCVDYGYANHFAALWLAKLPDDTIVAYRELYKTELTAKAQAELILASELPGERGPLRPLPVVMDPSMWKRGEGGTKHLGDPDAPPIGSVAHTYQGVLNQRPIKAMNARIPGWALIDNIMEIQPDGRSRMQIFNTCRDLIRTLPELPRDDKNPEDVDTHAEDHLPDAFRYGVFFLAGKKQPDRGHDTSDEENGFGTPLTAGIASGGF